MIADLEGKIVDHLGRTGPLTGSELRASFREDSLILWQTCMRSHKLVTASVGTRYLRLDRRVDGFARLSPSILREFMSYSVLGLADATDAVAKRAGEIASHIETVSQKKLELAYDIVSNIMRQLGDQGAEPPRLCVIIAGDIAYRMANDARRPEPSTGEFVRGSDIDLVVVLEDDAPEEFIRSLDLAIYAEKYRTLISPVFREELDYVIKKMSRVREQLEFDTFKHMVACKIMEEGLLLYGSRSLFEDIKVMLGTHGVTEKLNDLTRRAQVFRHEAQEYLLRADPNEARKESLYLFYPAEESEEFE